MGKIKGTHSSPGQYTEFVDLSYAANTDGITTLALVGETEKGAAFEPMEIANWDEYKNYFGGTNPEKFKDSLYPKYELPYIAKSYLKASNQLYVCRVLGLSGYNAGPAFLLKAVAEVSGETEEHLIGVLRSRGNYKKYSNGGDVCNPDSNYDVLEFACDEVKIEPYRTLNMKINGCDTDESVSGETIFIDKFTVVAYKDGELVESKAVSMNPGAKDYIYNVLGGSASDGTSTVFVEELYDLEIDNLLRTGIDYIAECETIPAVDVNAVCTPVLDFLTIPQDGLKRKNIKQKFVYSAEEAKDYIPSGETYDEGHIYEVRVIVDEKGTRSYVYFDLAKEDASKVLTVTETGATTINVVKVLAYDAFAYLTEDGFVDFLATMNNYYEQFRWAITPWVVSEIKGDATNLELKKLFRFHTITDGDYANKHIKISIANIRPDEGLFDVYIRDFDDSDGNPTILESYKGVNMVPGSNNYIGLKIGTFNGEYELRSKYVMVEVIENDMTKQCVPCGFLGYPTRYYGENIIAPTFSYNTFWDEDIKERKQYFGLSDIMGVDADMFKYKGKDAYTDQYDIGYTNAFHLDSRLITIPEEFDDITISVDDVTGITWDTVDVDNVTEEGLPPIIGTEEEMVGTIFENVKLRKFTLYPYGGFDGWDVYRKSRTNTDEFRANKYKGKITNGTGKTFSKIEDGTALALTGNCITSDYYAYLAGINQFENPERYEINLFATPGIDYVNNKLLVDDAIDMVSARRDTLYIPTTPDKPWGADDSEAEMYSSSDAASNLEDAGVDTYYAATYYPWVKYFDKDNNIYINLPVTKDAVRIMANIDNKKYPWVTPAGFERAVVECAKMHFFAKLEDRDNLYDSRINPTMSFTKDGVRIWGNKTMYKCDETNPMNRINTVRLMLYMKKLITKATRGLIFEPNDKTLADEFDSIVRPILSQIKEDRGITDFRLKVSQTEEQMDMHEMSGILYVKPTPDLEYLELSFVVTPQGISFDEI